MASLISCGAGFFGKTLGLLSSRSLARCTCVCPAVRGISFSTSSGGPPKRPLTGYLRYAVQQRPAVAKQYPDVRIVEITKKIAQEWRLLSPEQKKPYQEAALAARQVYKEEMTKFKEQLSPAQAAALKEEKRQKMARRRAIRKKRELTMLGKPKRPRSAFNIFMSEHFQEATGESMQSKMKNLFEDWSKLRISQKQVYMQLAEDDKIRYKNEMKSWEEHMVEVGREDLIRNRKKKTKPKKSVKAKGNKTNTKVVSESKGTETPASSPGTGKSASRAKKAEE
ncbi:transcription factor A, mitochondrial [Acipenser ruthenus]|uniref:transcription factor A, mitochondrial n=1 Tax=Acipenser ruthenus TaxID=7906 RepID=UPI002741B8A3|nr:transcription factor A, mitochondrial [Acipenser ruthenus]